jgi:sensitive to high expression protein 9
LNVANYAIEKLVKARLEAVQQAKDNLEIAQAQESSSRKEVVGLLERKHAWSDADLERYMNLIRSEHLNDQGVQGAKDSVAAAELSLEEARTRLEKRERMQYHEEQIWSDTIRRNSTWVTFGLMGLNIFLLLGTLIIIEPWRRRRLVKEIRRTLEENQVAAPILSLPMIAEQVDAVSEPDVVPVELIAIPEPGFSVVPEEALVIPSGGIEAAHTNGSESTSVPEYDSAIIPEAVAVNLQGPPERTWWNLDHCQSCVQDLFSESSISVRKVDVTTIALEGFAAGVALMGLLIVLFKPR